MDISDMSMHEILKDLNDVYKKRNEIYKNGSLFIPGVGEVNKRNNNIVKTYEDNSIYITVVNVHRKKYNTCNLYIFSDNIDLVIRKDKNEYSFSRIGEEIFIDLPRFSCPTEKDDFFHLTLDYDIGISYEEYMQVLKLFSQINHTVCINYKHERKINRIF